MAGAQGSALTTVPADSAQIPMGSSQPHISTSASPSPSTIAQPQASPSAPSISLTPATPDTAQTTHTSTIPHPPAPPTIPETEPSSTMGNATQPSPSKSAGAPRAPASPTTAGPTASSSEKAPAPTSASASASKPVTATSKPPMQKKKRKRKGFAGLLLALGCLSASEFEDEPKQGRKVDTGSSSSSKVDAKATPVPASASAPTKPAAPAAATKEVEKSAEARRSAEGRHSGAPVLAGGVAAGGVAGAALSGDKTEKEDVVVPPSEPTSPPLDETAGVTSSAVQPPGSGSELLQTTPSRPTAVRRESDTGTPADKASSSGGYTELLQTEGTDSQDQADQAQDEDEEYGVEEEYEDEEDRLIAQGGIGIPLDEHGRPCPLLPPISKEHIGRKCLVLDLDETLLHSSFKMLPSADYIVPVEIESQTHNVYVIKRPGVDHFLTEMGKIYEVVVFTASLSKYADPVLDMLDPAGVVKHRLFRESCYNHKGNYVKDLSQLGRAMETCIILDNSPASYIFHPNNAVPVSTWFNDPHDTELADLCPFLTDLARVDDIRGVLDGGL